MYTRTLYFHSPSARDNTDATREISPCNKSMAECCTGRKCIAAK